MRYYIFVLFLLLISCDKQNVDSDFEKDFNKAIKTVNDFDEYRGEINDSILAEIYFSFEYLNQLTGIKEKLLIPFGQVKFCNFAS